MRSTQSKIFRFPVGNAVTIDLLFWGFLAIVLAVTPLWERRVAIKITGSANLAALIGIILAFRMLVVRYRPNLKAGHIVLENGAALIAYMAVIAPITYLCARSPFPLYDRNFELLDKWIGYDWQAWADFDVNNPVLSLILPIAYASLIPQTAAILTILPLVHDGMRGYTFIRSSTIAIIIVCAISYVLPAAGPKAIYTSWYADWAAMRTSAPFTTSLNNIQGIIDFPSFHAALAVILTYSVRGLGAGFWTFAGLNMFLLIATPTYGHHYLVDVLAGILVAIIAIGLAYLSNRLVPIGTAMPHSRVVAR